jgi:O-antigen/teichoic acid export membrane protein/SAM-dependent methyltransferase
VQACTAVAGGAISRAPWGEGPFANLLGNAAYAAAGLLAAALVGKTHGPGGLGFYSAFIMLVDLYGLVAIWAIPTVLSRQTGLWQSQGHRERMDAALTSALLFGTVTGVGVGLAGYAATPALMRLMHAQPAWVLRSRWLGVALLFFVYSQVSQFFYVGMFRVRKRVAIRLSLVLSLLLLIGAMPGRVALWHALLLAYAVSGVVGLLLLWRDGHLGQGFSWPEMRELLAAAFPLLIAQASAFVTSWSDRFIVSHLRGMEAMGVFAGAMVLVQGVRLVPQSFTQVWIPLYPRLQARQDQQGVDRLFNFGSRVTAIALFFGLLVMVVWAEEIMTLLYGPRFVGGAPVLRVLAFALLVPPISSATTALLVGLNRPKWERNCSLLEGGAQLVLMYLLTVKYGVMGAAVGSVLGLLLGMVVRLALVTLRVNVHFRRGSVGGPALYAAAGLGVAYLMHMWVGKTAAGVLGSAVYLLAVGIAFRRKEERRMLPLLFSATHDFGGSAEGDGGQPEKEAVCGLERLDALAPRGSTLYARLEHLFRYQLVFPYAQGRLLDLGCGTGYGSHLLGERGEVVGLDVDAGAIAYAQEKYAQPGKVRFQQYDGERLPFDDGSFDLVVSFEVIEHLEMGKQEAFLREACRVLRPGGVLALSTPNRDSLTKRLLRLRGWRNPHHKHEFNVREWGKMLVRFGELEPLRTEFVGFPVIPIPFLWRWLENIGPWARAVLEGGRRCPALAKGMVNLLRKREPAA